MPNKLFIGNLGKDVSKHEVEEECGRYGRLQDVWVSRRPSGFAFVEFRNSKDASQCVQALDGRHVLGGRIRVEFAKNESLNQQLHGNAKRGERVSSRSPRRSRTSRQRPSDGEGLASLMLASSSTRLLPPPKPTSSMLAPVYDRSPSPLVVVNRDGGVIYEDLASCRSWDRDDSSQLPQISSSVLLPSLHRSSRSPQPRYAFFCGIKITIMSANMLILSLLSSLF